MRNVDGKLTKQAGDVEMGDCLVALDRKGRIIVMTKAPSEFSLSVNA